ncbi:hypothetical protein CR513_08264, partial [Mucuna pruriens]
MPHGAAGFQQPSPQYQAPSFPQPQQRVPTQGNSLSLEDLMKQLATSNLESQQSVSSSNTKFQQNMTATIQDLKMQIGHNCRLTVAPRDNCPIVVSISDHLGKETRVR